MEISTAILARTNQALRAFEEALSEAGIRYHFLGRSGFFAQSEVKNVLAYIQCAVAPTDPSVAAALRAPFEPSRFIRKKETLDALKLLQSQSYGKPSYFSLLKNASRDPKQTENLRRFETTLLSLGRYRHLSAADAVAKIMEEIRAVEYYAEEEEAQRDNDPVSNLLELKRMAARFQSPAALLDHVRKLNAASRVKKGVALATAHASKGMEFDDVYLVCCQEGILPHKNATEIGEEERIFFVACSRAAKHLTITYSGQPSRFLSPFLKAEQPDALQEIFG